MGSKMISFYVPQKKALLAVVGEVALRQEHMNYLLKMTIKSLTGVTPAEALKATMYESSRQLRDRVKKLRARSLVKERPL